MSWHRKRNRNVADLTEPCQNCPHPLAEHSGMSGPCMWFDFDDGRTFCQCESMTWAPD